MKKSPIIVLALLLSTLIVLVPPASFLHGQDVAGVQKLLTDPKFKSTQFSIHFYDLEQKKSLFKHRADSALMPASNMKLITTAAALDLLGPDFVYETLFGLHGGRLVVLAAGDPLTGDSVLAESNGLKIDHVFEQLRQVLIKRNIKALSDRLYIDATLFDDQYFHSSWPTRQADKWYVAQIGALNFNNNCLDVTFSPGQNPRQPARFTLSPNTRYVAVTNKCTTAAAKAKQALGASRVLQTNRITLIGACKTTQTISVTIDKPAAYFGTVLSEYLNAGGITLNREPLLLDESLRDAQGLPPDDFEVLLVHRTPLGDVLRRCNQRSLNMAAEGLFKTIGAYHGGSGVAPLRQGSWPTGRQGVAAFLNKLSIPNDQFTLDDGSGLSRKNRISADCLTRVLIDAHRRPYREMFRHSLATPKIGTLKKSRRFREEIYQDRLFAKTGYIFGAWGLSGYCQTSDGKWLTFSILANNKGLASPRNLIDKIVKEMID